MITDIAQTKALLNEISGLKIALIGDLALDIYWHADMKRSELSRETPHYPLPVYEERYYLGAGGNAAANIAALKPSSLFVCGLCGNDWRGKLLSDALTGLDADISGLICADGYTTNAYCKPMRHGISEVVYEDPRIDFTNYRPADENVENKVSAWLRRIAEEADVLVVADQFEYGVMTDKNRRLLSDFPIPVIVDSRYRIADYKNCILKPNDKEGADALRRLGISPDGMSPDKIARTLSDTCSGDVVMTLGKDGSTVSLRNGDYIRGVAYPTHGEIDVCGAGDTFIASFACTYAAASKIDLPMKQRFSAAIETGMAASSVTIHKIGITGTASRAEILTVAGNGNGGTGNAQGAF